MAHGAKIDDSLNERRSIVRLLERMKKENVSIEEMEEIGVKLHDTGRRALSPLVRRLWREMDGDVISRYAFLLNFFEDDTWIEQLIQIALRRKDLGEGGRKALTDALRGYGVDVNVPPFARCLTDGAGSLEGCLIRLLERGDEGLIIFMEDFVSCSREDRLALIRDLHKISDPRILSLLEILLWFDDPDVVSETCGTLGKIRHADAVSLLHDFLPQTDGDLRKCAERSLRRLAFLGVTAPEKRQPSPPYPFHTTLVSPVDAAGYRSVWLSRWIGDEEIAAFHLQIHDETGMRGSRGMSPLSRREHEEHVSELRGEEGLEEVAPDYALLLVRDAVHRSVAHFSVFPPDYYVQRRFFRGVDLTPAPYVPDFTGFDSATRGMDPAAFASLLDDEFLAGWFVSSGRVFDLAEEWSHSEKTGGKEKIGAVSESLLERSCREIFTQRLVRQIRERLLLTADLMRQTGRPRELVETTLATACSLDTPPVPRCRHPFLRRLARESLEMAREALEEGYDLREFPDEEPEGEWE